jgi:p-cumate 2,3-dioxygenase subunit alpha
MATNLKLASSGRPGSYVIDDREAGTFRVAREAFTSQAVFEAERDRIFSRCWLYVGHESEIPNNNDFVTRKIGGREIIFNRDRKGQVHAFLNTCPHRGALVERQAKGNAIAFRCFYHGWAFNNNGTFGTKMQEGDYGPHFNDDGCANLPSAPKADNYRGFWFLNFDAGAEPLDEYLADMKDILDIVSEQGPDGMEIIGVDQKYSVRANWKLLMENSYDGYHALDTHQTYFEYLAAATGHAVGIDPNGRAVDAGNGHAYVEAAAPWGRPVAQWSPKWGEDIKADIENTKRELVDRVGPERAERIATVGRNCGLFPNLVINDIMAITVRTFYPIAPDLMEVNSWALGVKGETRAQRKLRLDNYLEFLGPGGFSTPDDVEALEAAQRGYAASREAGWNDISRGMLRKDFFRTTDEEQMRCFWREWARRMEA